jgi:hypothetical protein
MQIGINTITNQTNKRYEKANQQNGKIKNG